MSEATPPWTPPRAHCLDPYAEVAALVGRIEGLARVHEGPLSRVVLRVGPACPLGLLLEAVSSALDDLGFGEVELEIAGPAAHLELEAVVFGSTGPEVEAARRRRVR